MEKFLEQLRHTITLPACI